MTTLDLAQIVIRRGTASQWSVADPILGSGEFGLETDTKLIKLGDGTSLWSVLTYQGPQLAAQINLATAKTTPVDADTFPLSDSAAANGLKKVSWLNILATIKTYYDSVVATLTNKTLTAPVVSGLTLSDASIVFEGATADAFETTFTAVDPTADRTITLPNLSGMMELTDGYTTTVTAGASSTLTAASTKRQVFTGTLAQTVTLPLVSTLPELGFGYKVQNDSSNIVTVQSSGANTVYAIPAGVTVDFICILLTGTTAASWLADYPATAAGGALNFITGATFSAVASFSLPANTFTATYDNYLVRFQLTDATAAAAVTLRLRAAGVDVTSASYYSAQYRVDYLLTVTSLGENATTSWGLGTINIGGTNQQIFQYDLDVKQIFNTKHTMVNAAGSIGNIVSSVGLLAKVDLTSYDSLTFLVASGTITGNYRVYGYNNS